MKNVFTQVYTLINKRPEPEPEVITPEPVPAPPPPVEVAPPQPVIIEVPVQPKAMDEEERLRSMMILIALAVLIFAVIIMVMMLIRGSRKKAGEEEYAQEAYLQDINGYTKQASYKLGNVPTMLGRVAGQDSEHLNYIVIPETTIGRRHALIEYKDFAYWIVDQGSINGTFVNDQLISSEVRLKHGDRIRLHKLEFEFLMPEMVDAGMTVVSKTVLASQPKGTTDEQTIARGGSSAPAQDETDLPEPDFDLDTNIPSALGPDSEEEDTVIKGSSAPVSDNGGDETIMLDDEGNGTQTSQNDDEATIRPDESLDDMTVDNLLDIDDESEKGRGKK
ncbi:MAG: FHA domain-containing protein [Gammaproteobacteria bacterium]|nr:FHA domain-containing protein [Gammaproteobacteria bacterium]